MQTFDLLYRRVFLPPVRYVTRNDAEIAHEWMMAALIWLQKHPHLMGAILRNGTLEDERLSQELMGSVVFPNPFGTAAGFDKNGDIYPALQRLTGWRHSQSAAWQRKASNGPS